MLQGDFLKDEIIFYLRIWHYFCLRAIFPKIWKRKKIRTEVANVKQTLREMKDVCILEDPKASVRSMDNRINDNEL